MTNTCDRWVTDNNKSIYNFRYYWVERMIGDVFFIDLVKSKSGKKKGSSKVWITDRVLL